MSNWVNGFKDIIYLGLESFGRYYSSYRGFVADKNDPLNLNRLRLVIPQVSGTNVYDYWAFPKGLYSGDGYGMQFIPEKGDTVWVEFENGHPNKPIWTMGYRIAKELPPNDPDLLDVSCFWLVTPKGHKIKINDTKNYIHIQTQKGDYVELNSNSISVVASKSISLGQLDHSNEPAVLGNKNQDVLNDLQDIIQQLTDAFQSDITISSGTLKYVNLQIALGNIKAKITGLKTKIPTTKSNKVTLD